MFSMFSKRKKQGTLSSPVNGRMIPIYEINDTVFSQKVLGDGAGFYSDDGRIYSPCNGKITTVADSKHALGIKSDDGVEIIIHVGIDTVEANGNGFYPMVFEGERVFKGQNVLNFDLAALGDKYDTVIAMAVSNSDEMSKFVPVEHSEVTPRETVISYEI